MFNHRYLQVHRIRPGMDQNVSDKTIHVHEFSGGPIYSQTTRARHGRWDDSNGTDGTTADEAVADPRASGHNRTRGRPANTWPRAGPPLSHSPQIGGRPSDTSQTATPEQKWRETVCGRNSRPDLDTLQGAKSKKGGRYGFPRPAPHASNK